MENPYIKQFPDLMSGKKIMYVHGFLSSGQSGTVKMLQELMPNATFVAEDIPVHPEEAVEMLQKLVEAEKPDLIIGTSMGGMYTEMLKGYDRILVNPAFEMGNTMSSMTGKQEFQNPRKDGVNELMVTKGLIKEYRDITERCFQDITPEDQKRVYGLFGDEDPVVHTFDLFHEHYPQAIHFHGTPTHRQGGIPLSLSGDPLDRRQTERQGAPYRIYRLRCPARQLHEGNQQHAQGIRDADRAL